MPYLFFLLASVGIVFQLSSCYLKKNTIETLLRYKREAPYDAVIVPGIPYDSIQPHIMLKVRMHWAKQLFEKGIAKNIIFSGAAVHSPYVEGVYMKMIADSLGIPSANTFIESQALHGTENIDYGYRLAKSLGFKKIAVATDPFQCYFLCYWSGQPVKGIAFLPFPVDSMNSFNHPLPQVDAAQACVDNFVPLKNR